MAANLTRVLSGGEENWVKSTAGGSGICVFGCLFSRVIDAQHVSAAVQDLLKCHSILRARIAENSQGKLCFHVPPTFSVEHEYVADRPWPVVVDDESSDGSILFDEDRHDKQGSLALHKIITEELNTNFLNPEGKPAPPVRVFGVLISREISRRQTIILIKSHIVALDRKSIVVVTNEFLEKLDMAVEGGLNHGEKNEKTEEGLPVPFEKLIPKSKSSKSFFEKGYDALGYAVSSTKYSLLPFQPSFTKKTPFQSRFLSVSMGKEGTVAFFNTCKKKGVSWSAALAAALLKMIAAVRELQEKGQNEFCVGMLTDCRHELEPKLSENVSGNYISGVLEGFKVVDGIDVWDFARHIKATVEKDLRKRKHLSEYTLLSMLYAQVMKYPSLTPKGSLRTALMNLSVDPPMPVLSCKAGSQLGLVGTVGPLFSNHYMGPCFIVLDSLSEGPELAITLMYSIPVHSHAQILGILQSSFKLLLEGCQSGDSSQR